MCSNMFILYTCLIKNINILKFISSNCVHENEINLKIFFLHITLDCNNFSLFPVKLVHMVNSLTGMSNSSKKNVIRGDIVKTVQRIPLAAAEFFGCFISDNLQGVHIFPILFENPFFFVYPSSVLPFLIS